jgi:hypothetical protein
MAGRRGSVVVRSLLRRDTAGGCLKGRGGRPFGRRMGPPRFVAVDPRTDPERNKCLPRFGSIVMAREHHCPNCGPQACNASTSKIHTCGVCAAIWEEDLSIPTPAPAPPRPATPAPATAAAPSAAPKAPAPAAAKPAAPPATPAPVPTSGAKPAIPTAAPAAPVTPAPKPATAAPIAPPPRPTPPPATSPAPASPTKAAPLPGALGGKALAQVVQAAKVPRCPQCTSDSLAEPSDFIEVQGHIALLDSQTYRGHWWYADTGELYTPPAKAAVTAPPPAAKPAPAPRPSA